MKTHFDESYTYPNKFVKHEPSFLKMMFGTTDLTPLWIADMDFKVAPEITEEMHRIVERGIYSYEFTTLEVFNAIAKWNKDRHGLIMKPSSFIQVTSVLTGISVLLRTLTGKGDGIIVQTPVYHQFQKVIEASGRVVIENELILKEGRYTMDFNDLEEKLKSGKAKTILLCNPHNPVGRVWSRDELQELITLATKYKATIWSDEIHSDILYNNIKFQSLSSFEGGEHHITILGSPAKTFGMHSIANGYLYVQDKATYKAINDLVEAMYLHHGNSISGYGTIAAYTKGGKWVDSLVDYLNGTVNWVETYLKNEFPQVSMIKPEGTYQIWLDFSGLQLDTKALNRLVFEKAKVGLAPGTWFKQSDTQFMRMNIASPRSVIQQAFIDLKTSFESLK